MPTFRLEENDGCEIHEVKQQSDRVDPLDFVEEDDHGAARAQVFEAQCQLREEEAAGLALEAMAHVLVSARDGPVANDEVECAAVVEIPRVEEVGSIRVRKVDLVGGEAHICGEHGDVQEVDLDSLALANDGDEAASLWGKGEGQGVSGGVAPQGYVQVGAWCHAKVENALGIYL